MQKYLTNINKSGPARYNEINTSWPSGIYPINGRLVQHSKLNVVYYGKKKNYMIICKDTEKPSDEIQHPFIIKTPSKLRRERNLPQRGKERLKKSYS